MSYLKKFPIDTLKIDKAFIDYCDSNKEDRAICTAIISLAKRLHLEVSGGRCGNRISIAIFKSNALRVVPRVFIQSAYTGIRNLSIVD